MAADTPVLGDIRPKRGDARYRLSGPRAFARVFKEGRRREGRYAQTVVVHAEQAGTGCFGMAVSRKALSRAVDRNRFKRQVREYWRQVRDQLADYDIVIRLKPGVSRQTVDVAASEAVMLMAKLLNKPSGAKTPNTKTTEGP